MTPFKPLANIIITKYHVSVNYMGSVIWNIKIIFLDFFLWRIKYRYVTRCVVVIYEPYATTDHI